MQMYTGNTPFIRQPNRFIYFVENSQSQLVPTKSTELVKHTKSGYFIRSADQFEKDEEKKTLFGCFLFDLIFLYLSFLSLQKQKTTSISRI